MKKTNKPSNPLKVFNDNRAMAYKKAGGAMKDFKKSLKKSQDGGPAYQGPLPEFAAKRINMWNTRYPSPSGKGFHPEGDYAYKAASEKIHPRDYLMDPAKSLHYQASNEFYNENADLLNKDPIAFNRKMTQTKPAVIAEIEKRKKMNQNSVDRLPMKPSSQMSVTPMQKKGGSVKSRKK